MALSLPEKKVMLAAADLAALAACIAAAFALVTRIPALSALEVPSQAFWSVVFGLLLLVVAYLNDCLDITSLRSAWRYLRRWWAACAVAAFVYLLVFFIFGRAASATGGGAALPRVVPGLTLSLAAFVVPAFRLLVERWLGLGRNRKNCVVVGAGNSARDFIEKASAASSMWKVCALVDDDRAKQGMQIGGATVAGTCADLPRLTDQCDAEEVILAITHEMNGEAIGALMTCFEQGIDIVPVVSATERALGRVPLQHLGNRWLPSTFWASSPMPLFYDVFKRGLDISVAGIALIAALPVVAVAAVVTKLTSRGPAFYRQKRVGMHGRVFSIYKIRTMIDGAEKQGAQWAAQNDARITPLGRILRATRIDELPQLWNVLRGDMTLVGPRPERPEFVEQLEKEIPFYRARLAVRPGITGWAQVKHRYASSVEDTKTKLEYDLFYIKHRWFWLDLLILGKTAKTVVTFRGQ
jgi:exopolysaccharide biosynthesis polyprenyl glycosylphosphotransferase